MNSLLGWASSEDKLSLERGVLAAIQYTTQGKRYTMVYNVQCEAMEMLYNIQGRATTGIQLETIRTRQSSDLN